MTVRQRITLLVVFSGLVTTLLFSMIVFYELVEQPFDILDRELHEKARSVDSVLQSGKTDTLATFKRDPYWIGVYSLETNVFLYRSPGVFSSNVSEIGPGQTRTVTFRHEGNDTSSGPPSTYRVGRFETTVNGRAVIIQVGRSMEKLHEEIMEVIVSFGAGLILSILALIAISRFVAGRILHPIGQMKTQAREITEKNLDRRLPDGSGRDEFSELARTINWMLDRLQLSFNRQREFLFDTSHELKTPLATIRLAIDGICSEDGGACVTVNRQTLGQLAEQVLRMERLVKDLLNLSSLEAIGTIESRPVSLESLLSDLSDDYLIFAEARNVSLEMTLSGSCTISGDKSRLNRAFSNILDNAIKYNEPGGTVAVHASEVHDHVEITVENTGAGVAERDIPHVFDQFYRSESSRSTGHGGSGLGLAIVQKIIELHSGTVSFDSRPGSWTRVTVVIPRK